MRQASSQETSTTTTPTPLGDLSSFTLRAGQRAPAAGVLVPPGFIEQRDAAWAARVRFLEGQLERSSSSAPCERDLDDALRIVRQLQLERDQMGDAYNDCNANLDASRLGAQQCREDTAASAATRPWLCGGCVLGGALLGAGGYYGVQAIGGGR